MNGAATTSARASAGFTLLELILGLALAGTLVAAVAGFFLMQSRTWQSVAYRQEALARLTNGYFMLSKRLRDLKADTLTTSTTSKVESGGVVILRYVPAGRWVEWNGRPVLRNVLATFTYSETGGWANDATGWALNHASGVIRMELQTLGELQERLDFLVHPRRRN